jgi:hypothetical protein
MSGHHSACSAVDDRACDLPLLRAPYRAVARMKTLATTLVVDLRPALQDGADPVACGIGFDGAIYAAARRSSTDHVVVRWQHGEIGTVIVHRAPEDVSFVQPFPGGLLLAGARCTWGRKGAERNAVAVDWSGRELARLTLGDGIQDLRVAHDGTIWASYFDEGVFGNLGWSHAGPSAIGSPGLVAFSTAGEIRFSYDPVAARTDAICDAYAMNVADDAVWLYFYMEFPIVRIRNGDYRVWQLGVAGAHALAVRDDRVLLFGDYECRHLGRVVELGSGGLAKVVDECALTDDGGKPLGDARACGVGGDLFFFEERRVLVARAW